MSGERSGASIVRFKGVFDILGYPAEPTSEEKKKIVGKLNAFLDSPESKTKSDWMKANGRLLTEFVRDYLLSENLLNMPESNALADKIYNLIIHPGGVTPSSRPTSSRPPSYK